MSGNPKRQRTQDGAAAAVAARPSFTGHLGRMMGVRPDLTLITSDGHRIPVHRTLLIITSPVFEGCMAAADGGISGMAAGGGGGGGTSTSAGNVAAASKRACPGSADELPVEGTAKEWAALLPLVYPSFPAMVMNMNFVSCQQVHRCHLSCSFTSHTWMQVLSTQKESFILVLCALSTIHLIFWADPAL